MVFTREEKYQIMVWHHTGRSYRQIQTLFQNMFQNRPLPSVATIQRIMYNIRTHGCLSPQRHKTQRQPRRNDDREARDILICASVEQDPTQSTRTLAAQFDISKDTVSKILRKHGYHSYKLKRGNEQHLGDSDRRMEFCEYVMNKANEDDNFIPNILFTDESSFSLHGRHNSQNIRWWARGGNPRKVYAARTQRPLKLNVWTGILGDHIIGPFIIDGNLNGQKYLELLQNQIVPALQNLPIPFETIWFQQDGCPAHDTLVNREYLNDNFPNHVIGRHGDILWPPRSPDLTPCDFFLWGYVKSKIYGFQELRANNLDELRVQIFNTLGDISPEMLFNVRRNFYDRLGYCLTAAGGLFEHLI